MLIFNIEKKIKNNKVATVKEEVDLLIFRMLNFYCNLGKFKIKEDNQMGIILEQIRDKISKGNFTISNCNEWAYFAGRLLRYILSQSATSGNKHILLESVISLSTIQQMNNRIIDLFERYKHAIEDEMFDKVMSSVLNFDSKMMFSSLKVPFYIGYFDEETNLFRENIGGN